MSGWLFRIILLFLLSSSLYSKIVINEFMASNQKTISDIDGQETDWIELYNPDSVSINLKDYTITDNPNNIVKWTFPTMHLGSHSFLLIWASDKDYQDTTELHTNFKLNASGEYIGIYNPNSELIDQVTFGSQTTDVSMGKFPDASSNLLFFKEPTPGQSNQPLHQLTISPNSGVYSGSIIVTIESDSEQVPIYYTLDGSIPTRESLLYTEPINISKTTILRVAILYNDLQIKNLVTNSYFINTEHGLPILSLVADSLSFWQPDSGIYVNWDKHGAEWERKANIALLEDGEVKFSSPAGVRIHGDYSRQYNKKSLRLHFKSKYGNDQLNYRVFENLDIDHFEKLVLYAGSRDQPSNTDKSTLIYNVLTHSIYEEMGRNISAYKPVVLYINNLYWGIYWIREHINEYYIEDHFGITNGDLNRSNWLEYKIEEIVGDSEYWFETYNFIKYNNMGNNENYQKVISEYIDIEDFIDYHILNIFASNSSWLHKNTDRYRDREGDDPRWRWILWDTDRTWKGREDETLLSAIDPEKNESDDKAWRAIMMNCLLKNNKFKAQFVNRFADLMNTLLKSNNILKHIDRLVAQIELDVSDEFEKWCQEPVYSWEANISSLKQFVSVRAYYQEQQIVRDLNLLKSVKVTIEEPEGKGKVQISAVIPDAYPWEGIYFSRTEIPIKAIPAEGYRFVRWENPNIPQAADTSFKTYESLFSIKAIFKEALTIQDVCCDTFSDTTVSIHWQTSSSAQSFLTFGMDSTLTDTIWNTNLDISNHQAQLSDLDPASQYYYQICAWSATGDTVYSNILTFKTIALPPVIETVYVDSITTNSVKFHWQTNEKTIYTLSYCVMGRSDSVIVSDTIWSYNWDLKIENLEDGEAYYSQLIVQNEYGKKAVRDSILFATQIKYPTIEDVLWDSLSCEGIKITWKTDDVTRADFFFGSDSSNLDIISIENYQLDHLLYLTQLRENTEYWFKIVGYDSDDHKVESTLYSFVTLIKYPVIYNVTIDSIANDYAQIHWATDEKTKTQFYYGTDTTFSMSIIDSTYLFDHAIYLNQLKENTKYYFRIHSSDSSSHLTMSDIYSFSTGVIYPEISDILIDSLSFDKAKILWKTNKYTHTQFLFGQDSTDMTCLIDTIYFINHVIWLTNLLENTQYYYKIVSFDSLDLQTESSFFTFKTLLSSMIEYNQDILPQSFDVSKNYPNPFNQSTRFTLSIPERGNCQVDIYDIAGRKVCSLWNGSIAVGQKQLVWHGTNDKQQDVVSGIYFCRILYKDFQHNDKVITKRFILIR